MLSDEAQAALDQELVMVLDGKGGDGTLYPHEQFVAALQQSVLDRVASLPQNATGRQACKLISSMRTETGHKATLGQALRRLREFGRPVDPADVRDDQRVVACFPPMT